MRADLYARAMATKRFSTRRFVLNCKPSTDTETDWAYEDAVAADAVRVTSAPKSKDLRAKWWGIRDQGSTGACVGFATADGVLRYQLAKAGRVAKKRAVRYAPSPRFIWMADKETDQITSHPTTFIETAGTQTKLALRVARKYGCVLEEELPMAGRLSSSPPMPSTPRPPRCGSAATTTSPRRTRTWRAASTAGAAGSRTWAPC